MTGQHPVVGLLGRVAAVFVDLEDALVPHRSSATDGAGGGSPDPLNRPAPASLDVVEHRHKLVRGLRWWVDAVHDGDEGWPSGSDVAGMCRWLATRLAWMAAEDRAELAGNLREWLDDAWPFLGDPRDPQAFPASSLPPEALDQRVRVADAARVLGCTVRTIQRRVPVEQRPGGVVLLREAWRCEHCDLRHGECAHTRAH